MSANPPLRKPRHSDGRLMTEDEIRGLDGRFLDVTVLTCVILGEPLGLLFATALARNYSTDIAAAFDVDRPDWLWSMGDRGAHHACSCVVMVWENRLNRPEGAPLGVTIDVVLKQDKLLPNEYARARCIAALLLAAQIGE